MTGEKSARPARCADHARGRLPDLTVEVGYFFLAPAGTPKPIVEKLSDAITKGLHDPKVWEALAAQGVEKKEGGPEETRAYLADETAQVGRDREAVGGGREVDANKFSSLRSGGGGSDGIDRMNSRRMPQSRWTHIAMPMPPPMQRVARPFLASRFCIS